MSESTDIRSLLTSRSRARVAPRDSSLTNKPVPVDVEQQANEPLNGPETQIETQPLLPDLMSLQRELNSLPQVGKRLAVHLEQQTRARLLQLCDRHELTPEIVIEAALNLLQEKPDFVAATVDDAKVRLSTRKRAGLLRRTIAMAQKYGA